MAEDDIYNSKSHYERFLGNLDSVCVPPQDRVGTSRGIPKYYCRNRVNLGYFRQLAAEFEARDLSYVRRHRLMQTMKLICSLTEKDLRDCTRDDINRVVAGMHTVYQSPRSKETFIRHIRRFWRLLFPELDERGRPDEAIVPYVVRHLSSKIDRSREKLRKDKLTWEEFEKLLAYFGRDARMQAYLSLALECLGRPQELLYLKVGDVELHDDFAKVYISEHGKEGVGLLQCIDSFPYVVRWLEQHPLRSDKNAFLFVNLGNNQRLAQLKPKAINRMLRTACDDLKIDKPITCYSLKRSGVTLRRLRGDSDMEIQHAARWTSTKQLKTYDLSSQDEAFRRELEKRGLVAETSGNVHVPRVCTFCDARAGIADVACPRCKRPLDRVQARKEAKQPESELGELRQTVQALTDQIQSIKELVVPQLAKEIRRARRL